MLHFEEAARVRKLPSDQQRLNLFNKHVRLDSVTEETVNELGLSVF